MKFVKGVAYHAVGPTPPPGAAARGFTKLLLHTDFSSTGLSSVDLANTGDPCKQWFVQNSWADGGWPGAASTPAGSFTSVSGGIGIAPASNDANVSMMSVYGTGGPDFEGVMVDGGVGFYVEITCSVQPGINNGLNHTSLWLINPIWDLWFPTNSVPAGASTEFDVLEIVDSSNNMLANMHEWVAGGGDRGSLQDTAQWYGRLADTDQHSYGIQVTPQMRQIWFDGVHIPAVDVMWSLDGTCPQSISNTAIGLYNSSSITRSAIIIGGPIRCLSKVQAWGPPG